MATQQPKPNSVWRALTAELEGLFDLSLDELPNELQLKIRVAYSGPATWDHLEADQRQCIAKQFDAKQGLYNPETQERELEKGFNEAIGLMLMRERALRQTAEREVERKKRRIKARNAAAGKRARPAAQVVSDTDIIELVQALNHLPPRNLIGAMIQQLKSRGKPITRPALTKRLRTIDKKSET